MEAVSNTPEDVSCDAHTRQLLGHQVELEQIATIPLPTPSRSFQMLETTPFEKQERQ